MWLPEEERVVSHLVQRVCAHLDTIGVATRTIKSATPPTASAPSLARADEQAFERVARDAWDIIAARCAAVASQMHHPRRRVDRAGCRPGHDTTGPPAT